MTRIYKQGELAVDFDNREWSTALVSELWPEVGDGMTG